MGERFADQIKITASPDGVSYKNKTVDCSLGEVTLDGLKAGTQYESTIEVNEDGKSMKNLLRWN